MSDSERVRRVELQGRATEPSTPMQSLYSIRAEEQGKRVLYLIRSSRAP